MDSDRRQQVVVHPCELLQRMVSCLGDAVIAMHEPSLPPQFNPDQLPFLNGFQDEETAAHAVIYPARSQPQPSDVTVKALPPASPRSVRPGQSLRHRVAQFAQALTVPAPPRPRRSGSWVLSTLWLGVLSGFTATGIGAAIWLTRLPPPPDCQQLSAFAADVDQLYCVKQAAESGKAADLAAGVQLVQAWTDEHPLYEEAQVLLSQWSGSLLLIAQEQVTRGEIEAARETAQMISPQSPAYETAQTAIQNWQTEWQQGETLEAEIIAAVKQQQWNQAHAALKSMLQLDQDYWVGEKGGELRDTIRREQGAFGTLNAAEALAAEADPEQLGDAIALLQTIPLQSYAWDVAKTKLDTWSQDLLRIGFQRWEQGDLDGAIAAVQQVPADPSLTQEAKDLIQISYAEKAATYLAHTWLPSIGQLFSLQEAMAAVQTIPRTSPFYEQAQELSQQWQLEQEDLVQLQYASIMASFGQKAAYQLAIRQAETIDAERPRREIQRRGEQHPADVGERERLGGGPVELALDHARVADARAGDRGQVGRLRHGCREGVVVHAVGDQPDAPRIGPAMPAGDLGQHPGDRQRLHRVLMLDVDRPVGAHRERFTNRLPRLFGSDRDDIDFSLVCFSHYQGSLDGRCVIRIKHGPRGVLD